ncbi:MAG TPA: tryptophan synthase subunit beta [Acidimicrobiales bacterium]|nr:tryptophan synthase subunit beta [Acidimicrobiales bacterium]
MTQRDQVMGEPDELGHFGDFGGRFVPEALMPACLELEEAFRDAWRDDAFVAEYQTVLRQFAGRPTPVTPLPRLSERLGLRLFAKREDLAHTGSHKINNVIGQTMLTKRMGKPRVIAETGAGQHGVATATAAARLGLACTVFMGEVDTRRQELNVFRMELLGATVVPVTSGSKTLKDAVNEAMREWVSCVADTHYCLGSVMGPHPFPWMVREFQSVIGIEAAAQLRELGVDAPDAVVACVGGGSNAAGVFAGFADSGARLVGVEAAGGAAVRSGSPGVLHGMRSLLLQDEFGQIEEAHSISAGLDYPGIGPEHAHLAATERAEYYAIGDDEVLGALSLLSECEGIIPALETAHAVAWIAKEAGGLLPLGSTVLLNLSGRGDKDVAQVRSILRGES